MPKMSDLYIFVLLRVSGKNLEAKAVNPIIEQFNSRLRELKIEEVEENGKIFKAWVSDISEFEHELINRNTLICSRRVRFEVRDQLYDLYDNRANSIQLKIHKALMGLKVESEEITIETTNTHITGNMREGRWPRNRFDGAGM